MTTHISATYECDRCHVKEVTNGDDPPSWHEFSIQDWSRLTEAKKGHLCLTCTRDVVHFIRSNPRDPHGDPHLNLATAPLDHDLSRPTTIMGPDDRGQGTSTS